MPVLRGAVTFARFRSEADRKLPSDTRRWTSRALASRKFEPLDPRKPDADRAAGFVELEDPDATGFASGVLQGDLALFAYRVDTIKVPAAAVKAELERWLAAFPGEKGRPPTKREKAEKREAIRHGLRQKATPTMRVFDVSWNLASSGVQIWASSRKVVEEVVEAVEAAFEVKLRALTPAARAAEAGVADGALAPTPELAGVALGMREVSRGGA
jgi:recombination associated protein RdgC